MSYADSTLIADFHSYVYIKGFTLTFIYSGFTFIFRVIFRDSLLYYTYPAGAVDLHQPKRGRLLFI